MLALCDQPSKRFSANFLLRILAGYLWCSLAASRWRSWMSVGCKPKQLQVIALVILNAKVQCAVLLPGSQYKKHFPLLYITSFTRYWNIKNRRDENVTKIDSWNWCFFWLRGEWARWVKYVLKFLVYHCLREGNIHLSTYGLLTLHKALRI